MNLKIELDGNEIFTSDYNKSIGNFVGIRFKFIGAGEVRSLSISSE